LLLLSGRDAEALEARIPLSPSSMNPGVRPSGERPLASRKDCVIGAGARALRGCCGLDGAGVRGVFVC
jgi:hypothetical protein